MSTVEQQAKAPADLRNVISFLRSSKAGMKTRTGVLNGKRIDYFKGPSILLSSRSFHSSCSLATSSYITCVVSYLCTRITRQSRHQSHPLPRLRQTQKCPKGNLRGRSPNPPSQNHPLRILPPRRPRPTRQCVFLLHQTPPNKPHATL